MAINNGFEALKFPVFIPEDPKLWMAQMETAFRAGNISCSTQKYNYLLSSLDGEAAKEVRDLIMNPPQNLLLIYEQEKQKLLQRLCAPTIRRLLASEQMGERTPSQFLCHLKTVAGPGVNDNVIKAQWIDKFPNQMQEILRTRMHEDTVSLGKLADLIVGFTANEAATAAAANRQPPQQVSSLEHRMTEGELALAELEQALLQRVDAMSIEIAKFFNSMNNQMKEMRLAIIGLQNENQAEITKPD